MMRHFSLDSQVHACSGFRTNFGRSDDYKLSGGFALELRELLLGNPSEIV
jgi:hypothetical protein